jgi:hypothetical protein
MSFSIRSGSVFLALMLGGCIPLQPGSSFVQDKLKTASAGFTGCMPDDNSITNVSGYPVGNFTWNATCKDKTYLCSAVQSYDNPAQYHCAPAVE